MVNIIDLTVLICVHSTNDFYDSLLIRALQSLENQTYKNFTTLIVLDGCWDKTENEILNKISNLKLEIHKKPTKSGLHEAKNFGLSHVNSQYVAFLDGDDLYVNTKLEQQISFISKNPNVDFLSTQSYIINGSDDNNISEDSYTLGFYDTHEKIKERIFNENMLYHGSFLIRRSCITELGGYNQSLGSEDWDLWKRAITKGFIFHQLPERLYKYRIGTSQPR